MAHRFRTPSTPRSPRATTTILALLALPLAVGCESDATSLEEGGIRYRMYGLDFGPFVDGQDPNRGATVDEAQVRARMELVADFTDWVRMFGSAAGLRAAGRIAHELGLRSACAAWLSRNLTANESEMSGLIAAGQAGECDLAIVGSETLLRNDLSPGALIDYLHRARAALPGVPVTTAEVHHQLRLHPEVVGAVDVVLVNYYPYWEGVPLDQSVAYVHALHRRIQDLAGGKAVWISETGWPSCGDPVHGAEPSPENASAYALNFVSWARSEDVPYFYFAALDEAWKARYEGAAGACWGVFDRDGMLKPGMERVFEGRTLDDNWSVGFLPGGPGTPAIELTSVPPRFSSDDLEGQVWHVAPFDYGVAVYIRVRGRWWTKPYFSVPITSIRPDGSFTTDVTTGGVDPEATEIAAFLVPFGYAPPLAGGAVALPAELETNAVASVVAVR